MEITRLQSWRLAGKAIQGIKLGGLARRPVSKGIPEGEDAKESGMGRVHVVTVDSSEVLYLPGGGGEAVDLKRRCEARDAQSSGSPSSLVFDETEALFVTDFAKRAIISQRPAQPVALRACVRACVCALRERVRAGPQEKQHEAGSKERASCAVTADSD
jgi:hypothetical protein